MTGLVWVDTLTLSPAQWIGVLASMAIMLWHGVTWRSLLIIHAVMLWAFWNVALSTDTRLLFQSAAYLQRFTWSQFLSEFAFRDYVKLQPPFYTFWVSRFPALWAHQIAQAAILIPCGLIMRDMYGTQTKCLLATPVYLLMSTQPSNDVALFVCLVCTMRLVQFRRRTAAAVLYGLAFLVKPLMLITVPFMLPRLRWRIALSGIVIGVYYQWSIHYHFGIAQWGFLAQQLLLKKFFALLAGGGSI